MNKRYLQFPLMLLFDIHLNYDEAMVEIARFATVNWALKQEITQKDAARQAIYDYYRQRGLKDLNNLIFKYIIEEKVTYDEIYTGYTDEELKPEDNTNFNEVIDLFNEDEELFKLAIKNAQLSNIGDFFGIENELTNDQRWQDYKRINEKLIHHENQFGKEPMPTIEKDLFWDLYEEGKPELFSGYIAIRSLQGHRKYTETTRKVILMRMLGAKSYNALQFHLQNETINKIYQKYTRTNKAFRYHFDKLFKTLQNRGLIKSRIFERSVSRKLFLSTRIGYEELADNILQKKNRKNHKKKEYEARQKIRNETK